MQSTRYRDALAMQRILSADCLDPSTPKRERAGIARAWCDLNEELRKLAMKPLPKSIDVTKLQKRRRQPAAEVEPTEA